MGIFTQQRNVPTFNSRSEAFDYMFAERVNKGDDYAEAADKADRFADIITRNKELPATTPKPKNGIEKAVGYVEQLVAVKKEHPEVWELVVGGIGGLVSGFLVKKDMNGPSEATPANIDFDNLD